MQNLFFIKEIGFVLNLFYSFCLHSLFDNAAWKFCRFFFFFNNKIISTCTETKQTKNTLKINISGCMTCRAFKHSAAYTNLVTTHMLDLTKSWNYDLSSKCRRKHHPILSVWLGAAGFPLISSNSDSNTDQIVLRIQILKSYRLWFTRITWSLNQGVTLATLWHAIK